MATWLRSLKSGLAVLGLGTMAHAGVDITSVILPDGRVEVRLRPDQNFSQLVSSVLFTVRWDASADVHLGALSQPGQTSAYVPVIRSGGEQEANGYRYQIFASVSLTPMDWVDESWQAGQEYVIARINPSGPANFHLAEDDWTFANNGDYYVSLNGLDTTGDLYSISTSTGSVAAPVTGLQVMPNPTDRDTWITYTPVEPGPVRIELFDATGRSVQQRSLGVLSNTWRGQLEMGDLMPGVYLLRVTGKDQGLVERIVRR